MKYVFVAVMWCAGIGMAQAACPEGYTFNNALQKCEIAPVCPPGFTLHPEHDLCISKSAEGTCPKGSTYNAGEKTCETPVSCPTGTVFHEELDKCLKQ